MRLAWSQVMKMRNSLGLFSLPGLFLIQQLRGVEQTISLTPSGPLLGVDFSRIVAVNEFPNGRVLIVDGQTREVFLSNAEKALVTPVGQKGSGPGEYLTPSQILPLGRDSVAILDYANSRLIVVFDNGKTGSVISLNGKSHEGPTLKKLVGSDTLGYFYAEGPILKRAQAGQTQLDSFPIDRILWRLGSRSTMGYVTRERPPGSIVYNGMVVRPAADAGFNPFASQPEWVVAENGLIAVVEPSPYRVRFYDTQGTERIGPVIPFRPIGVSEGHKRQWRADQQRPRSEITVARDGATSVQVRQPPRYEPSKWPAELPAFLPGAVSFDRLSRLWVRRTTRWEDPPTYDVIGSSGAVLFRVEMPRRTRIVGFGRTVVFAVRLDDDDGEHLESYRLPS